MSVHQSVLELIGRTPIVRAQRLDAGVCELYLKLESHNPGGSIKDRIGLSMIESAEKAFSEGASTTTAMIEAERTGRMKKGRDFRVLANVNGGHLQPLEQLYDTAHSPLVMWVGLIYLNYWADLAITFPEPENSAASKAVAAMTKAARAGVKAMKIDGAFASAIAGAQETPGGAVDIEGTATGTNSVFIGPDGRHLGGTTTSKSNLNATLAAQGVTLPIVIDASSTITVLP